MSVPITRGKSSTIVEEPISANAYGSLDGAMEGADEGTEEGSDDGCEEGNPLGVSEGMLEGELDGAPEGLSLGDGEGRLEGEVLGREEGGEDGLEDGWGITVTPIKSKTISSFVFGSFSVPSTVLLFGANSIPVALSVDMTSTRIPSIPESVPSNRGLGVKRMPPAAKKLLRLSCRVIGSTPVASTTKTLPP